MNQFWISGGLFPISENTSFPPIPSEVIHLVIYDLYKADRNGPAILLVPLIGERFILYWAERRWNPERLDTTQSGYLPAAGLKRGCGKTLCWFDKRS